MSTYSTPDDKAMQGNTDARYAGSYLYHRDTYEKEYS